MDEITKTQKVLLLKNGLSVWLDLEDANAVERMLEKTTGNFFSLPPHLGMQSIYNIEGFYTPQQYSEIQHFKNGGWKCVYGKMHQRKESCFCETEEKKRKRLEYENEYYQEHGYYPNR